MMRMQKRGYTACAAIAVLATTGLWAMTSAPAAAGDVQLSIRVPGLAIHTGPQGVAVAVGQPGFYGEIGIGDLPAPPPVIYAQPVIIAGSPAGPPVYLRVPAGYERHWAEHCAYYHACARPVYFVRDDWYQRVYVPRYRHIEEQRYRDERFREAVREREFARDHDRDYHADRDGHRDYDHRDDDQHDYGHGDHGRDHDNGYDHGRGHGYDHGHDQDHDRGHDEDHDRGH